MVISAQGSPVNSRKFAMLWQALFRTYGIHA
jgi:hypothetical protein